jgi:hypothetical protein
VARLDPQIQLKLTVNPVNPFVVSFEVFDIAHVQKAQSEAPIALVVRLPHQPSAMTLFSASSLALYR